MGFHLHGEKQHVGLDAFKTTAGGSLNPLVVAPAAGVWCVRGGRAGEWIEVAGVSAQPGAAAGPLPTVLSPGCLVSPTDLRRAGSVPGESHSQEDLGMWLTRSGRTTLLSCAVSVLACFD